MFSRGSDAVALLVAVLRPLLLPLLQVDEEREKFDAVPPAVVWTGIGDSGAPRVQFWLAAVAAAMVASRAST